VTCRPIFRRQVGKHVSAEIRFLDTNYRWVLNVSMDMGMEVVDPYKPDHCCEISRRVHGYQQAAYISWDTTALYKWPSG
jgi:hypothetical protein